MTREAFIKKWLANPQKQYNEQFKDEMRDDLDHVIDYHKTEQNSHKHSVMQAEGSDVSEGAAVGQRSVEQSVSADICLHQPMLKSGLRMCMHCLQYY